MSDLENDNMKGRSRRALSAHEEHGAVDKLRLLCLARGTTGILGLGRALRRMRSKKHTGEQFLDFDGFKKGLYDDGLILTNEEEIEIFNQFDVDRTGYIDVGELLIGIRPFMSDSRKRSVSECFRKLDKSEDGHVPIAKFKKVFSCRSNPKYISGELSEEEILAKFLHFFEEHGREDGKITEEEFENYYAGVSASVEGDAYFDLMLRQDYKL